LPPTTTTSTTTTTTTLPPTTTTTTTLPPETTTLPPETTTTSPVPIPPANVWDALVADPQLSAFANAVQVAGLVPLFQGLDPEHPLVSPLVPNNDVLAALPEWGAIQSDPQWLVRFVRAQVLPGSVPVSALFAPPTDPPTAFVTLEGDVLTVDLATLTINGAHVDPVAPEVTTPAGVLHVTDKAVVVPPQVPPAEPIAPTTVAEG
jgi:hypothetical protein